MDLENFVCETKLEFYNEVGDSEVNGGYFVKTFLADFTATSPAVQMEIWCTFPRGTDRMGGLSGRLDTVHRAQKYMKEEGIWQPDMDTPDLR